LKETKSFRLQLVNEHGAHGTENLQIKLKRFNR